MNNQILLKRMQCLLKQSNHSTQLNLHAQMLDMVNRHFQQKQKSVNTKKLQKRTADHILNQSLSVHRRKKMESQWKKQNSVNQVYKSTKRKIISKNNLKKFAIKNISNKNIKFRMSIPKKTQQNIVSSEKVQKSNLRNFKNEVQRVNDQLAEEHKKMDQQDQIPNSPDIFKQIKQMKGIDVHENKAKLTLKQRMKQSNLARRIKFAQKRSTRRFANYLESHAVQFQKCEQLSCPICLQVLLFPISTQCGHTFCFQCLDESVLFCPTCPVCRLNIKGNQLVKCSILYKYIDTKIHCFADQRVNLLYHTRKDKAKNWIKSRVIEKVQVGMQLDVRDTQNIWCKAKIQKIYTIIGKASSVLIHYLQWAKVYDQIIDITSSRLASFNHFTSRTDLPRYNLNSQQENMRGAVITGNNQNNSNLISPMLFNLNSPISLQELSQNMNANNRNIIQASQNYFSSLNLNINPANINFLHQFIDLNSNNQSLEDSDIEVQDNQAPQISRRQYNRIHWDADNQNEDNQNDLLNSSNSQQQIQELMDQESQSQQHSSQIQRRNIQRLQAIRARQLQFTRRQIQAQQNERARLILHEQRSRQRDAQRAHRTDRMIQNLMMLPDDINFNLSESQRQQEQQIGQIEQVEQVEQVEFAGQGDESNSQYLSQDSIFTFTNLYNQSIPRAPQDPSSQSQ